MLSAKSDSSSKSSDAGQRAEPSPAPTSTPATAEAAAVPGDGMVISAAQAAQINSMFLNLHGALKAAGLVPA